MPRFAELKGTPASIVSCANEALIVIYSSFDVRIRSFMALFGHGVMSHLSPLTGAKRKLDFEGQNLRMSHDIIVKQHRGSIDVDTRPGQFTDFNIVLPRTGQM
jgi:hypothetical protein